MNRRSMLTLAAAAGVGIGASNAAESPASRSRFVAAKDGTRLFSRDWGRGPAILFVSGLWLNSQAWQYQMIRLCDAGFRCVAFDRRGHGRSDDPGGGYDMDTLADDVAAVIEHYDLHDFVLVGHSMGGAECVRYLTRHGSGRVRRLVLIAPTTPYLPRTADNPQGVDPAVTQGMRAALVKDFPGLVGANIRPFVEPGTSDRMIDWIMAMMFQTSLQATMDCNQALSTADFRGELPQLELPTLVIQGDKDVSVPLDISGRRTAALMKNARLVVYEGAPHGLIYTRIEQLHQDMAAFVAV
ncbi:MAG: alpha/beta hydrolase [Bradyrhizobium sp.]|uniref:alpha/beta fold hydrolase n=1 Tax=Bradyrhizobium sp. TaxID=376 RepID=UPI001D5DA37A|nr:alpha/beta hydrolase [Bradyrhizobium sp.]MBV9564745.1 alpha/beta hydrolase [Bradyrhizobium sp.]